MGRAQSGLAEGLRYAGRAQSGLAHKAQCVWVGHTQGWHKADLGMWVGQEAQDMLVWHSQCWHKAQGMWVGHSRGWLKVCGLGTVRVGTRLKEYGSGTKLKVCRLEDNH